VYNVKIPEGKERSNVVTKDLISHWLRYIDIEQLNNIKIEEREIRNKKVVPISTRNLSGNTITFLDRNIEAIKAYIDSHCSNSGQDKNGSYIIRDTIYLMYPLIKNVKKRIITYYPLLVINIPSTYLENILNGKVDFFEFDEYKTEITISQRLLQEYFLYEDEELAFTEFNSGYFDMVRSLTGRRPIDYKQSFYIIYNFFRSRMEKLNIKDISFYSNEMYIGNVTIGEMSRNIYNELKNIQKYNLFKNNISSEYLYHIAHPDSKPVVPPNSIYHGCFESYPLSAGQEEVMNRIQHEHIVAVQGPPGTGKTTLLLSIIAQSIVKRAAELIYNNNDYNNLMVITSQNNQAIQEVIGRFKEKNSIKHSIIKWLYLEGGRQTEMLQKFLPKIDEAINYLSTVNTNYTFIPHMLVTEFCTYYEMADKTRKQYEKNENLINSSKEPWIPKNIDINTVLNEAKILAQRMLSVAAPDINSIIELSIDTMKTIEKLEQPTVFEIICSFVINIEKRKIKRFTAKHRNVLSKIAGEFEPVSRKDVVILWYALQSFIEDHKKEFYKNYRREFCNVNSKLFDLAIDILWYDILRRKKTVINSLRAYRQVLSRDTTSDVFKIFGENIHEHLTNISLIFPVITTTLHSAKNIMPHIKNNIVHTCIIDEAAMIPLHLAFPLVCRSANLVVVGDPKQIPPVIPLTKQQERDYYKIWEKNGYALNYYELWSPTRATVYHRAALCNKSDSDCIGYASFLNEHRRCAPEIVALFSAIAKYNGLSVETTLAGKKYDIIKNIYNGKKIVMYHVDGKREGNINQQEIDKIFKTIIFLKEKGIKPEIDLGIVTPYRSQAYKMKNDLSQFVPAQHIGTVHTFQGGEFSIIIMSTVLCDTEQPTAFINSAPNILNVAISRAKYLLIIVCNTEILATAGGHLTTIYEHAVRSGLLLKK
jgi:hypothetical protein